MNSGLALRVAFWSSVGLVVYTYLVYPAIVFLLAGISQVAADLRFALFRGERRRGGEEHRPSVSLVIAAHNEEAVIEEKMRNCEALDYPRERLEILVGCDGCNDRTVDLARAAGLPHARVVDFAERSGKPAVLNRLLEQAKGDLVVFSDANTMLDAAAVSHLGGRFADPTVGCVCGDLRITPAEGGTRSESIYWRLEVLLKFMESRLGLLLGANGGIYAIRRELFEPLPRNGIIDDFLVAMHVRGAGYQVVFDPEAFATEAAALRVRDEFRRRIRIGAGGFHALGLTASMLSPFAGRIAFSYWSHKVLRWLVPFLLPVAYVSALLLSRERFYALAAAAGTALLLLAVVGHALERSRLRWVPFMLPYYLLSMNVALFLGFVRFLTGGQTAVWERTERRP
jgi:cellulose synthase/poly-beta-1,6-N-acetylglucosamine synthase-like glycosyltransferase